MAKSGSQPWNLNLQLPPGACHSQWKRAAGKPSHPARRTALSSERGITWSSLWYRDPRESNAVPSDTIARDQRIRCMRTKRDSVSSFHPPLFGHRAPQKLSGRRCTWSTGQVKRHRAQRAGSKPKRHFWSCHWSLAVKQPLLPSRASLLVQAQASQPDFFKSNETNGTEDFSLKKPWGQ